MGRRFRKKGQPAKADSWRGEYKEIPKENALLERYYNTIIPEAEREAFWTSMRTVLPATFRLVGEQTAFAEEGGEKDILAKFEKIPFVPNAYKLPTSRRELRKDDQFVEVHRWLLKATEAGLVCRQEAVSMLPPLCLKIDKPDLVMLDMCAAPGSKTGQLLEYLAGSVTDGAPLTGMVIANDADKNRAFMLHHQVRRLHSPALLVTCNDASMYPNIYCHPDSHQRLLFDRVLCDVPCSGDGTLRKTPSIWQSWSPHQAFGLHSLQRRILKRGLNLLRPGGRLVYSTCSLNPVEDEAVVASVLKETPSVRLVKVDIPNLTVSPGRTSWSVMTSDGEWHDQWTAGLRLAPTFFPPDSIDSMNVPYTFRVLPHHQDTGGFYVAVFERQDEGEYVVDGAASCEPQSEPEVEAEQDTENVETSVPSSSSEDKSESAGTADDTIDGTADDTIDVQEKAETNVSKKQRVDRFKFDKFHVIDNQSPLLGDIFTHYFGESNDTLLLQHNHGAFMTRSADHQGPAPRSIVFCTRPVASVIRNTPKAMRIVNAGVRAFERYEPSQRHRDDTYACQYRILSEFLYVCRQDRHLSSKLQVFHVDDDTMAKLVETDTTVPHASPCIPVGGSVVRDGKGNLVSVWKTADAFIRPFISKQDRSTF